MSSLNIGRRRVKSNGFPSLAAELVRLKVDLIVAVSSLRVRSVSCGFQTPRAGWMLSSYDGNEPFLKAQSVYSC